MKLEIHKKINGHRGYIYVTDSRQNEERRQISYQCEEDSEEKRITLENENYNRKKN